MENATSRCRTKASSCPSPSCLACPPYPTLHSMWSMTESWNGALAIADLATTSFSRRAAASNALIWFSDRLTCYRCMRPAWSTALTTKMKQSPLAPVRIPWKANGLGKSCSIVSPWTLYLWLSIWMKFHFSNSLLTYLAKSCVFIFPKFSSWEFCPEGEKQKKIAREQAKK